MPPLVRKATLLEDETGLHILPLGVVLLEHIGPQYLTWGSEGLRAELTDMFGEIGVITWDRIQALRVLQIHDAFWKDWEVFEKVTAAICGEPPIFSLTQPPESEEIAIALDIASKIDKHEFSAEVQGYIAAACLADGLWYLEPPLDVAQEALQTHDNFYKINRSVGEVAAALSQTKGFHPEGLDPILTQVNRVLDVRLALKNYNAAVEQQFKKLPDLVKESKR